jgi:SNF2 family DNA or RNA helicase
MSIFQKRRKRYFNKIVGYKNLDQFREKVDPYFLIRRTREVASELPQLISKKVMLEMTSEQEKLYNLAKSGELYRRLVKEKYYSYQSALSLKPVMTPKESEELDRLRKRYDESMTRDGLRKSKLAALALCQMASNGPGWLKEEGESSKEVEFTRLFDQELSSDKVIVFSRFKSGIPRLEKILDNLGQKHVKIDGDMDNDQRQAARMTFQDPVNDYNVIFITQAGSAAINLQAANHLLFYDTPWSYGDLYQTIGRAQRIGSIYEHINLIHMVNQGTIDEHVLKVLEPKKQLINDIMGDIAEGAIEFKDDLFFSEKDSDVDVLFDSVFGTAA